MRRSELAGAEREFIDLDGGTLGLHLDLAPHITDDRDALIESLLARGG